MGLGGPWLGGLIALGAALNTAEEAVRAAKFCEDCKQYMAAKDLGVLNSEAAQILERKGCVAADQMTKAGGSEFKAKLFYCKSCGKGFLELTVHFKTTWGEKDNKQTMTAQWLAGSVELRAEEVDLFWPHGRGY